jgi:hypothetical protein
MFMASQKQLLYPDSSGSSMALSVHMCSGYGLGFETIYEYKAHRRVWTKSTRKDPSSFTAAAPKERVVDSPAALWDVLVAFWSTNQMGAAHACLPMGHWRSRQPLHGA